MMRFSPLTALALLLVLQMGPQAFAGSTKRSAADQALHDHAWKYCSNWRYNVVGNRPYINYKKRWFRCEEQHNNRKGKRL